MGSLIRVHAGESIRSVPRLLGFARLSEQTRAVPVAGSAYTFSYATLGESIAWIIGWDLILESALGTATVSVGWSRYLAIVLDYVHTTVPAELYGTTTTCSRPDHKKICGPVRDQR